MLFLDSDIHIRGDFKPLFDAQEGIQTVGDNFYYRDLFRNADDFSLYESEKGPARGELWDKTFSAGMMMFAGDMYSPKVYQDMVDMIDVNHFGKMSSNHSDQLILNQYFRGRYKLVSATYNWRFNTANEIYNKDGVKMETAAAIHYTAKKKPWNPIHAMRATKAIGERYIQTHRWWQEDWIGVLDTISKMAPPGGRKKPFKNLA
jgi:lipopolysaccharide biosynthesis glycosyltransferase